MDDGAGPTVRSAPRDAPAHPADGTSVRRTGRRGVPALVWALTALHVGLLLCFSLLYPPFTGFDEAQHVDATLSLRYGEGWPGPDERVLSEALVVVATPTLNGIAELPFSDDDPPPREQRPSLAATGVERPNTTYLVPNQILQHPPLYYGLGAAVLAVVPGSDDWAYDRTVGVLRLLGVLLMAPLPLLAWATARRLGAGTSTALAASALTLSVPQLQRVGAAVNNDSLYVLAFAAGVLVLVPVARGDVGRRTALVVGAVVGIALLSKGFALALVPATAVAYLVGRRRGEPDWWRNGLLALALAFVVGGWWWLRNLIVFGTIQPDGSDAFRDARLGRPRPEGSDVPVLAFLDGSYERLSSRFWGGLGINYQGPATFPALVTDLLVVASLAAVVVALVRLRRSRAGLTVGVLLPFIGTVAIVLVAVWGGYSYSLRFPGAQGRYLFGSLPGLAAGVALGLGALVALRLRRLLPLAVLLLAAVLQGVGLWKVMAAAWMPPVGDRSRLDRFGTAVDALVLWSPWPPLVTALMAAVPVLAGLAVLVLAVRHALVRPGPLDDGEPQPA